MSCVKNFGFRYWWKILSPRSPLKKSGRLSKSVWKMQLLLTTQGSQNMQKLKVWQSCTFLFCFCLFLSLSFSFFQLSIDLYRENVSHRMIWKLPIVGLLTQFFHWKVLFEKFQCLSWHTKYDIIDSLRFNSRNFWQPSQFAYLSVNMLKGTWETNPTLNTQLCGDR